MKNKGKPVYLNLVDGNETNKHISPISIEGRGSTSVTLNGEGNGILIYSTQQEYGIADEENPGLIKDGGDISIDEEGNVNVLFCRIFRRRGLY